MTELPALHRALLDVRRRLRAFLAALAAQIIAPSPPDPRPNPAIHGGRNASAAPFTARRAAAASRRVPPPSVPSPLGSSNASTLQLWRISLPRPEYPNGPVCEAKSLYIRRMALSCNFASWNSRNPCLN